MGLFDGNDVKPKATEAKTEPQTVEASKAETKELSKGQVHAKAYREALEKVCKYCKENNVPADILDACKIIRPSFFGLGGGGGFQKAEFRAWQTKLMNVLGVKTFEEIKVGATFDEMKVFMTLKAGRKEMKQITNDLIAKPGDKVQVWVSFDADKGVYKVEGVGEMPKGWTGYVPQIKDAE